jgi:carbamoyl-phosphate synthase large subunit
MSKVVLITGIGGDIAQAVAMIIRQNRPNWRLIGVDIHAQHGGHRVVDHFVTVPRADDADYPSKLLRILADEKASIFMPMSEPELAALRPFHGFAPGVTWITAGSRVIDVGLDKLATINALADMGLPVPWTFPVSAMPPPDFPCVLKSRLGSGSRSVFIVSDTEEVSCLAKRVPNGILQELLQPADREVTCAVYRTRDGRVDTLQMLRRLTGGFTGWARVIRDDEVSQMCEQIAVGLDLRGSMNVQLRITNEGPRVFEINPRFSSTVLMRHQAGFTDVLWALSEAEGKRVEFPVIPAGMILVRVQGAAVLEEDKSGKET